MINTTNYAVRIIKLALEEKRNEEKKLAKELHYMENLVDELFDEEEYEKKEDKLFKIRREKNDLIRALYDIK